MALAAPSLPADPGRELPIPAFDLRAALQRAAVPVLVLAAVAAVVVVSDAPLDAFAAALGRALDADARWVAAAALFELLSFGGYVALLWLVGSSATARMDLRASAQVTLGGAAATRLLPAAGLGGVAMTLWALHRAGLGGRAASRTLLTFLVLLYSIFLTGILVSGAVLALGLSDGSGPLVLSAVPAAVAGLAILGSLALGLRRPRPAIPGPPAHRLRRVPAAYGAAVRAAVRLLRTGDLRLLGAPAWWACDAAVLWALMHALGTPPALAVIVLGYFVGQVANTLPIPGAVSGGMVGVLLAFGVAVDLALASVLAYRAVAIWLPTPIGLLALRGLRVTVSGWAREEPAVAPTSPLQVPTPTPVTTALEPRVVLERRTTSPAPALTACR